MAGMEKAELNLDFLRRQLSQLMADRGMHAEAVKRFEAALERARNLAQQNEGAIQLLEHMIQDLDGSAQVVQIGKPSGGKPA